MHTLHCSAARLASLSTAIPPFLCHLSPSSCPQVVRKNLRVRLGDIVSVHQCPDVKYGKVRL
jgi:hypothetical protein